MEYMLSRIIEKLDRKFSLPIAKAHCDVPCGIYDPIIAQISALTIVRMVDLINENETKNPGKDIVYHNNLVRYISVKEEHAEKVKQEVRIIWGDFIKAQHLEGNPDLHQLVQKIMQLGSKCRQTVDREAAIQLVDALNQFAEIFWKIKGVATKKAKAPYAPGLELIYPDL
jgi:nickel superoxide dismutase